LNWQRKQLKEMLTEIQGGNAKAIEMEKNILFLIESSSLDFVLPSSDF